MGIMEQKMETTIMAYIGFRVLGVRGQGLVALYWERQK